MRQITDNRQRFFIRLATDFVKSKSEYDRRGEQEYEREQIDRQRIAEQMKKFALEKIEEIIEQNERTAFEAVGKAVIVERHSDPGNRPVAENSEPNDYGQHHGVHVFVVVQIFFQFTSLYRSFRFYFFRFFRRSRYCRRPHCILP